MVVADIEVVPGSPTSIVFSRVDDSYSPYYRGMSLCGHDGACQSTVGVARIEFLESPSIFYGYGNNRNFYKFELSESAIRLVSFTPHLVTGYDTDIVGSSGRVYGTDGSVTDAELGLHIGSFQQSGALAVDPILGRAFIASGTTIGVFDLNTLERLVNVAVPGEPATDQLVKWGSNGLAFLDRTELIIVTSPAFGF